jgi:hypothetical protein
MKNSNDNIGNRSRGLPVCRAVPQPLRYLVPPILRVSSHIHFVQQLKVKVKAAFRGVFGTEAFVQVYCTLAPRNFLPSPLEALCISQTHSTLC